MTENNTWKESFRTDYYDSRVGPVELRAYRNISGGCYVQVLFAGRTVLQLTVPNLKERGDGCRHSRVDHNGECLDCDEMV